MALYWLFSAPFYIIPRLWKPEDPFLQMLRIWLKGVVPIFYLYCFTKSIGIYFGLSNTRLAKLTGHPESYDYEYVAIMKGSSKEYANATVKEE